MLEKEIAIAVARAQALPHARQILARLMIEALLDWPKDRNERHFRCLDLQKAAERYNRQKELVGEVS